MHISQPGRRDRNVLAAWAIAVADAVRSAAEQSTGLGGDAPAALVAIVADPGLSIDDLRRVLDLTHPGTVRLVDRLAERGWIRREQGTGRKLRLEATAAGQDAERRLAAAREEAVAALLTVLPDQDIRTMADLVSPVLAATRENAGDMRRLCRLCDRDACEPCPAEKPLGSRQPSDTAGM
ncbi:MAG: MarR family winged helix-turn-helix transcriptional regulator [Streptosporangiaceae bacterium]